MTYHIQSEPEGSNDNLEDFSPYLTFCWHSAWCGPGGCGCVSHEGTLLTHFQLAHQNAQILPDKAAFQSSGDSLVVPRIIPPWVPDLELRIVKFHVFFSQILQPVQVLWKAVQVSDASLTHPSFARLKSQLRVHCVLSSRSLVKVSHQY